MLIEKIDEPALHQFRNATTETGWRQCPGHGEADGGVLIGVEHPVGEDAAGFRQTRGIEGLKPLVDERANLGAPPGSIVGDGLAGEVILRLVG